MMKEIKSLPPNWFDIQRTLNPEGEALFCFGDTVYNPSGNAIAEDIWVHEHQHELQQAKWSSPAVWWAKYLQDPEFRLEQELEAYGAQYNFVKAHYSSKATLEALFDFALNLCSLYGLKLSLPLAEAQIRLKAKSVIN